MLWLETGFDVCRQGCVSFSHPTNQNHAGREEQPETLQIQAEGRPGRAPGLSSLVGVCVLLCLLPSRENLAINHSRLLLFCFLIC